MAGRKKAQYEDALNSISDFIFKNSGKRVRPRPSRISGELSGTDPLALALAEIASKPGVHFSESLMRSINDTFGNQNWLQFHVDKLNEQKHIGTDPNSSRYRVRTQDLAGLIKDPKGFVDGVFKNAEAERKWAAKIGFAGYLDGATAYLWAKKRGLSYADSMRLFASANFDLQPIHREEAHVLATETAAFELYSDKGKAEKASKDLYKALNSSKLTRLGKVSTSDGVMGREFTQSLSSSEKEFWSKTNAKISGGEALDPDTAKRFKVLKARFDTFGQDGNAYSDRYKEMSNYLVGLKDDTGRKKYTAQEVDALLDKYIDARDLSKLNLTEAEMKSIDKFGELNPTTFRRMLTRNYEAKLARLDPVKDKKEYENLVSATSAIGLWQRTYGGPTTGEYGKMIGRVKDELKNTNLPAPRRKELEALLEGLNKESRNLSENRDPKYIETYTGTVGIPKIAGMRRDMEKYLNFETKFWRHKEEGLLEAARSGNMTPALKQDLENVRRRLSILDTEKGQLKTLPWAGARITVGQISNMIRTYQAMAKGDQGAMLVNGLFWVSDSGNALAPGAFGDAFLFRKNDDGKVDKLKFTIAQGRNDLHPTYAKLASLYYLSPASLMKTFLWNGEGFAFVSLNRQKAAMSVLDKNKKEIMDVLGWSLDEFEGKLGSDYIGILGELQKLNNPSINKFLGGIQRVSNSAQRMAGAAEFYDKYVSGLLLMPAKKLQAFILEGVGKLLKGRLLKGTAQGVLWNKAVDQFTAGAIGMKQLIQKGVEAILMALNVTVSGGTMSFLIGAVSYAVTEFIYKVGKPVMEVLAAGFSMIMILFFAIILFFIGLASGGFANKTSPYRSYYPGSAIACTTFNPHAGMYPEPAPNVPGTNFPPSDSSCPFTFSPAYCTQGDGGNSSGYHQSTKAIDIGTNSVPLNQDIWYAPSDGKIVKYQATNICRGTGKNYGGWIEFRDDSGNIYTILHAKALAPVGAVKKGTAVAMTQRDLVPDDPRVGCWTGPHFHLHVASNGSYVDSEDWYRNKLKCSFSPCP